MNWWDRAACKGRLELFFARDGEPRAVRAANEAAAKALCAVCPVWQDCRTDARRERSPGVWGGENESERKAAGFGGRPVREPTKPPVSDVAHGQRTGVTHGLTSTYQGGCRCEPCKQAAAEHRAYYRQKRAWMLAEDRLRLSMPMEEVEP